MKKFVFQDFVTAFGRAGGMVLTAIGLSIALYAIFEPLILGYDITRPQYVRENCTFQPKNLTDAALTPKSEEEIQTCIENRNAENLEWEKRNNKESILMGTVLLLVGGGFWFVNRPKKEAMA